MVQYLVYRHLFVGAHLPELFFVQIYREPHQKPIKNKRTILIQFIE